MKHGLSDTYLYRVWGRIKTRCYNPNDKRFHRYGGRGITMCDEWLHNPESFIEWALANGFKEGLSIDRIDNDGSYSPENCRWITIKEQERNKTCNVRYQDKCVTEWAEIVGIKANTIFARLYKGWDIERAIFTPLNLEPHNKGKRKQAEGKDE